MTASNSVVTLTDRSRRNTAPLIDRSGCPARRHGDESAHRVGCICPDAKEDRRVRRKRREQGRNTPGLVPALGTRRRIEALQAMGWTGRDLGERLDLSADSISMYRRRDTVLRSTATQVHALYLELWDKPGPSDITRKRARARGFAPAAAWDNIDDPHERPKFGTDKPVRDIPIAQRDNEVARLTAAGRSARWIAREFDITERTVERALQRFRAAEASPEAA